MFARMRDSAGALRVWSVLLSTIGFPIAACLLPSVTSDLPVAESSSARTETPPSRAPESHDASERASDSLPSDETSRSEPKADASMQSEPAARDAGQPASALQDAGSEAPATCSPEACKPGTCSPTDHGAECSCPAGFRNAGATSEMISNCPTDACKHGKCRELVNNYWCECDQGYMLSGRECVPYTETALKKNADGTVSVSGTMTLWQDPAPAMSRGMSCGKYRMARMARSTRFQRCRRPGRKK